VLRTEPQTEELERRCRQGEIGEGGDIVNVPWPMVWGVWDCGVPYASRCGNHTDPSCGVPKFSSLVLK